VIRLNKLTDYSIVLLIHITRTADGSPQTARDLSEMSKVPLPTVGRLLKRLAKAGFLESYRGVNGGYTLAGPASGITVADIVRQLEGPIGMTECSCITELPECATDGICPALTHWQTISNSIASSLEQITLADMARPVLPSQTSIPVLNSLSTSRPS
jgi:FeS assembly SUF system regulator